MRGRYPLGLEAIDNLEGSAQAKERLKVILQMLMGECRLCEACDKLQLSEPRVQQLREQVLTAALISMEPGKPGRRRRVPTEAEMQVSQLQAQLEALVVDQRATLAREEIALILPRVGQQPQAEKKKARQRKRRRRRGPRTST
jgi:16S rRNA G1207 methylase RsmC